MAHGPLVPFSAEEARQLSQRHFVSDMRLAKIYETIRARANQGRTSLVLGALSTAEALALSEHLTTQGYTCQLLESDQRDHVVTVEVSW